MGSVLETSSKEQLIAIYHRINFALENLTLENLNRSKRENKVHNILRGMRNDIIKLMIIKQQTTNSTELSEIISHYLKADDFIVSSRNDKAEIAEFKNEVDTTDEQLSDDEFLENYHGTVDYMLNQLEPYTDINAIKILSGLLINEKQNLERTDDKDPEKQQSLNSHLLKEYFLKDLKTIQAKKLTPKTDAEISKINANPYFEIGNQLVKHIQGIDPKLPQEGQLREIYNALLKAQDSIVTQNNELKSSENPSLVGVNDEGLHQVILKQIKELETIPSIQQEIQLKATCEQLQKDMELDKSPQDDITCAPIKAAITFAQNFEHPYEERRQLLTNVLKEREAKIESLPKNSSTPSLFKQPSKSDRVLQAIKKALKSLQTKVAEVVQTFKKQ